MNAIVKTEPQPLPVAATPAQMLAIAVQRGDGLEVVKGLMDLQERWEANQARKEYTAAMTGFKAEPIKIEKRKHVEFTTRSGDTTSYNHAELSDITAAIGGPLAKHALSYRWNVKQDGQAITVECVMTHVAGHSERVAMTAPPDASGGKNTIQQIASTTTYLQRYTLLAITGLSTQGADDDGRGAAAEDHTEWTDAIAACATLDELKARKKEMVDAWKGVTNIPKALTKSYNERLEALRKAKA